MGEPIISPATMASQAGSWIRRVQYELDTTHLLKATCDEVALLFSGEDTLNEWVTWAKGQGYEHFGSIERDRMVETWSGGTEFDVRFEFLRLEGFPFRIEAMCVLDGSAPLHEATLERYGNGAVVHVSWRAAPNGDSHGYVRHRQVLEHLDAPLRPLREYRNSYGIFCYYGDEDKPPFLKPRVNLRDTA